jgi:hypothetical protein
VNTALPLGSRTLPSLSYKLLKSHNCNSHYLQQYCREYVYSTTICSPDDGETTCSHSCSLAKAVVSSPVYSDDTWQWVSMHEYVCKHARTRGKYSLSTCRIQLLGAHEKYAHKKKVLYKQLCAKTKFRGLSHVVTVTDPYGRILGFLDRSPLHFLSSRSSIVLTTLSGPRSRPLFLRKSGNGVKRTRASESVAKNSDH